LENRQIESSSESEYLLLTLLYNLIITFVLLSEVIDYVGWLILNNVSRHFLSIFLDELSPQLLLCDQSIVSLIQYHLRDDKSSVPGMGKISHEAQVVTCEQELVLPILLILEGDILLDGMLWISDF
jgi:transcriptional antiterminator